MTKSELIPPSLYTGRALYGMHALWASVLSFWNNKNDSSPWEGIDFDKVAHCIHLIWNELHRKNKVSFNSPYESAPGIHGPGPALRMSKGSRRTVHAIKFIDLLQESQEPLKKNTAVLLFHLQKTGSRYKINPGRERTWSPMHLSDDLPPAFKPNDIHYNNLIAETLSELDRAQIRSLGTHQSKEGTIDAIEYNVFIQLFRRLFIEFGEIRNSNPLIEDGDLTGGKKSDLPSLEEVTKEIRKKTDTNKDIYRSAYDKLKSLVENKERDNEIAKIILNLFEPHESIWGSPEIVKWREYCDSFDSLIIYARGLRATHNPVGPSDLGEKTERQIDRGNEAADILGSTFGVWCPSLSLNIKKTFDWEKLFQDVIHIFDKFPIISQRYKADYEGLKKKYKLKYQLVSMIPCQAKQLTIDEFK